jgi:hypothetical protein
VNGSGSGTTGWGTYGSGCGTSGSGAMGCGSGKIGVGGSPGDGGWNGGGTLGSGCGGGCGVGWGGSGWFMDHDYPIPPTPKRRLGGIAVSANAAGIGATLMESPTPLERLMHMSKRNLYWLAAVVAAGVVLWIAVGWIWGIVGAVVVLVSSEVVERSRRKKLRAARGDTSKQSLLGVVKRERPSR